MSEREDLAKLVFMADNSAAGDPEKEWAILQQSPKYLRYTYVNAAQLIVDAYPAIIPALAAMEVTADV